MPALTGDKGKTMKLKTLVIVMGLCALAACGDKGGKDDGTAAAGGDKSVNVYNWSDYIAEAVSYTHLDVYKRQPWECDSASDPCTRYGTGMMRSTRFDYGA